MLKLPHLAGFEGLLDLDRRGVDIRPTLLRVITDQYVHSLTHTPDEERQYTELALRLLDETDIPTRAAVAARLASQTCAPRAIILQLARDVLEVAEPVLRRSPRLTSDDLAVIAAERGPAYAEIIGRRTLPEPPAPPTVAPYAPERTPRPASPPDLTPAAPPAAPLRQEAAPSPAELARADVAAPKQSSEVAQKAAPAAPDLHAAELCELFFAAAPFERRLIMTALDYLPRPPKLAPTAMPRTDVWRLESAALQHNTDAVVRELERALRLSRRQARRIVNDEMGEPIVAAAKALQVPDDVLQRMLLFMNPRVGQSVDRVYELAALFGDISTEAACHMIAIWRDADPPDSPAAKHEALWRDAVEDARQALSDITRRSATRKETPTARPAERASGADRR
jgi:hypothetical protein